MGGKRKSVALEWKMVKSAGKGNFSSKQECTKINIKKISVLKIYKSLSDVQRTNGIAMFLNFYPYHRNFLLVLFTFAFFVNAQSFKKQSLDFFLYTALSYRVVTLGKIVGIDLHYTF